MNETDKTATVDQIWNTLFSSPWSYAAPGNRIPEFLKGLCKSLECSSAQLLIVRSGVLFKQEIYPEHKPQVFAVPSDIKAWRRAERGSPVGPDAIGLPVRHSSNDPLTEHRLKALVIVRYDRKTENAARRALTQNSSVFRAVTAYLGSQLESAAMASLAGSHQRLTSLQTKLVVSADLCYQVAHAITKHLAFVGWCGVYRIRGSVIEAVSVLPSWSDRLKTAELSKKTPILVAGTTDLFAPQKPSSVRAFLHSGDKVVASIGKINGRVFIEKKVPSSIGAAVQSVVAGISAQASSHYASWIVCPLRDIRQDGDEQRNIGMFVIASEVAGISAEEIVVACELSAHCIPALARDAAMESQFELLESAAAVDPEIPLHDNQAFRRLLQILCDSFRGHRNADIVTLIPFDNKTGTMRLDMVSSSPYLPDFENANPLPSDRGVLKQILEAGELEWHHATEPGYFLDDSFVARHSIKSFYAVALKHIPEDGGFPLPLGVLFIDYKSPKRARRPEHDRAAPGFTYAEKAWIQRYATIAGKYLFVQARTAQTTIAIRPRWQSIGRCPRFSRPLPLPLEKTQPSSLWSNLLGRQS